MKILFADTSYWVALINPHEELHQEAIDVSKSLGNFRIITSEMVLTEVLNKFSEYGEILRKASVELTRRLQADPNTKIIAQMSKQFNEALESYANRRDKEWSLTDCASIQIMEKENVTETLTHDQHFEQAGFVALLR